MARATGRQAVACDRAGEKRRMSTSESESKRSNGMARATASSRKMSVAESSKPKLEAADVKPLLPSPEKITQLFSRLKLVDQSDAQVPIAPSTDPLPSHRKLDTQETGLRELKKYKRTAEGDPDLLRPLLVLMQDMDYLLGLLDAPYSDGFLGLYNFMWDRMRAIRMDLRIQHISNPEAASMLEQMIRLHIIAMHELCEHGRGKGSPEGFDAHLNIEQMNKAFVELFQMYEDHRRKGMPFSSESEFRAYYALLKLGSHPGHKVEPAELSLELSRLSMEVRHSGEIAFARDVAKLAKKATYLQACLMHSHFWKVRTEALATLHSSFRSNQGMPLARLENMLAMKGEDVKSFAEAHGFVLKCFEELYMVKNGLFVKKEQPPSKWSPLVGIKRSHKMKSDVYFSPCSNKAVGGKTETQALDEQASNVAAGANRRALELEESSNNAAGANRWSSEFEEPSNKAAEAKLEAQEFEEVSNKIAGAKTEADELDRHASDKVAEVKRRERALDGHASDKAAEVKRRETELDWQASDDVAEVKRIENELEEPSNKVDGADMGAQQMGGPACKVVVTERGAHDLKELALNVVVGDERESKKFQGPTSNKAAGAKRKREPDELLDDLASKKASGAKRKRGAGRLVEPSYKAVGAEAEAQEFVEQASNKAAGAIRRAQELHQPPQICTDLVPATLKKGEVSLEEFLESKRLHRESWMEKEIEKSHQKFLVLYDKVNKVQDEIDKILYIYF